MHHDFTPLTPEAPRRLTMEPRTLHVQHVLHVAARVPRA
jgi:hypothetical protein